LAASYDAVVIGAGHNGLICGAYLARAGLKVCVLERRSLIGGACVTEEVWPGYRVSTASYVMTLLQPKVILDLELARFGYEIIKSPPLFQPFPDGRHIVSWDRLDRLVAEYAKFSPKDADAYPHYREHMLGIAATLRRLLWEIPVDPFPRSLPELLDFLRFAWRFRGSINRFLAIRDLLTMSAFDYLSRWFESDVVKLAIGFYAAGGGGQPASMKLDGTAYMLARSFLRDDSTAAGGVGFVRGGMGGITEAIAASGRAHSLETRTDAAVSSMIVKNGRATGVRLSTGEEISARVVIANASAQTTFLKLVQPADLPSEFRSRIAGFRTRSTCFKVHLAVDRLPRYSSFDSAHHGFSYPVQLRIAPSIGYMEEAFADAEQGHISRRPYLTVMTPSVVDASLAPTNKHVITIFGGHAPPDVVPDDQEQQRDMLYQRVAAVLDEYAPGFGDAVLHRQVLAPWDLEQVFDLPGGHVHHGDMGADQLFHLRPARHYARYRSPIPRLYVCGASTHPGGGVTGVNGHNAAQVVLADARRGLLRS